MDQFVTFIKRVHTFSDNRQDASVVSNFVYNQKTSTLNNFSFFCLKAFVDIEFATESKLCVI